MDRYLITVIDTETTGLGDEDQVLELAAVTVEETGELTATLGRNVVVSAKNISMLIQPTVPVNVEARAAHHITDNELKAAALAPAWRGTLETIFARGPAAYHNADFDMRLIRQTWSEIVLPAFVCTYRCALHIWPDAPSYSNQVLRYWLDLKIPRLNLPPHRALPDAVVTAYILRAMLQEHTVARLIEMTGEPVILRKCRFGKHAGVPWAEVPKDYMQWILRQDFDRDVVHTCKHYLGVS